MARNSSRKMTKRRTRRSSRLKAPVEVIGEGASGCVISPALSCPEPTGVPRMAIDERYVSKYFGSIRAAKQELIGYQAMEKIDKEGNFTIRLKESCNTFFPGERIVVMSKCKKVDTPMFKINIEKVDSVLRNTNFKDSSPKELFRSGLTALLPVFRGLVVMKKYGIVHADIKPDNIGVMGKDGKCKLIDYGLLTSFDDIINDYIYRTTPYKFWPRDLAVIYAENPEDAIAKYDNSTKAYTLTEEDAKEMVGSYFSNDMRVVAEKWDTYGLGMTLFSFFSTRLRKFPIEEANYEPLLDLLDMMLHPNVYKRAQPEEVLAWVEKYLSG